MHGVPTGCKICSPFPLSSFIEGDLENCTESQNVESLSYFKIKGEWLIDTDNLCLSLQESMYTDEVMARLDAIALDVLGVEESVARVELNKFISQLSLNGELFMEDLRFQHLFFQVRFLVSELIAKHQYHFLDPIDLPELLKKIINRESYVRLVRAEMLEMDFQTQRMTDMWTTEINKKLYGFIDKALSKTAYPQISIYPVHNNILVGLLYTLIGPEKLSSEFNELIPDYGAMLKVNVFEDRKGEFFVNVEYNARPIPVFSCSINCPLGEFKEKLAAHIIDDFEKACLLGN
jgi:hypothetical protein